MTEMHEVVTLLLARMESHPEEFHKDHSEPFGGLDGRRWQRVIETIVMYGAEEEKQAIKHAMRKIQLAKAHEDMMDELFNGPERRAQQQNILNTADNNMGASLNAAPHPTKKIVMTQAEMSIIDKLTKSYTPAEKDQFIKDYAKSKREMQK